MSVFWIYFIYSVMEGRYSRSLNSPPFLMILDLFKSTIVSCKGPKEMRGVCGPVLEIFPIFCFHRKILQVTQFSTISHDQGLI